MRILKAAALAVILSCFSVSVQAMAVLWTLDDVEFDDDYYANGSFVWDSSTSSLSNISITTTGTAAPLPGATYRTDDFSCVDLSPGCGLTSIFLTDITNSFVLSLEFVDPLLNAGSMIYIEVGGVSFERFESGTDFRNVVSGAVVGTALAEPGTLSMLTIGLAGIAWMRRRKSRDV